MSISPSFGRARDLSWLKSPGASRDKQKAKRGITFLGFTSGTSSLILMKGHGVREADRDIALVAEAAGSEGLGYSRNTPPVGQLHMAG